MLGAANRSPGMAAYEENDTVPAIPEAMSAKLAAHVSRAGLASLKSMLEHAGVLTYACLGAVSKEELHELCLRVRAAGFGLGHVRALQELCSQAFAEAKLRQPPDSTDEAPVLPSSLSPMLYFRLARKGLRGLEPIFAQCGVQSVDCLEKLNHEESAQLASAITAAGFNADQALIEIGCGSNVANGANGSFQAMSSLSSFSFGAAPWEQSIIADVRGQKNSSESSQTKTETDDTALNLPGPCRRSESESLSLERPAKRAKVEENSASSCRDAADDLQSSGQAGVSEPQSTMSQEGLPKIEAVEDDRSNGPWVKEECRKVAKDLPLKGVKSRDSFSDSGPNSFSLIPLKRRLSREMIDDVLRHLKKVPTEIIRHRDKATGKLQDARIPSPVLALLRLRASCTGKPVSEERIARLAVDVMEENAYDPVRAFSSLSPASLLLDDPAVRVMGSGYVGIVFMEERTGTVVKVMLEDFAEKEYEVFCAFANVGLAARPIGLHGPQVFPGGSLYSIHMEAITHTLSSVLHERVPGGPRRGLNPPSEATARRIAEAIVKALQQMWDNGLVHGDLHLENIALRDPHLQPLVQLLDFGRSARNIKAPQSASAQALRAGHEYDVFRLLEETYSDYDDLKEETEMEVKDCQKEVLEIRRDNDWGTGSGSSQSAAMLSSWASKMEDLVEKCKNDPTNELQSQLHDARQIAGLQAYIAEAPKVWAQVESTYNIILTVVVQYACAKLDLTFDGEASLSNRRMRQAISKRQRLGFNMYFKSHLFWGT